MPNNFKTAGEAYSYFFSIKKNNSLNPEVKLKRKQYQVKSENLESSKIKRKMNFTL